LLQRVSQRHVAAVGLGGHYMTGKNGLVVWHAHDHVGVVPSLCVDQPEATGGIDHALRVQDHQTGPAPWHDQVRAGIG